MRPRYALLALLFVAIPVSSALGQSVYVAVDRGSGGEYSVGELITVTYGVSVDADLEFFDVSPSGERTLVDRRRGRAGQEYTLTGAAEPPLGLVVFEVRAVASDGRAQTASTFVRIVASEAAWAWLPYADLTQARLISRDLLLRLPVGHVVYNMFAAPSGGIYVHSGYGSAGSSPTNAECSAANTVTHVAPNGSESIVLRGAYGVFSGPNPNVLYYIDYALTGILEFDLNTGMTRKLAEVEDWLSRYALDPRYNPLCAYMIVSAVEHDGALAIAIHQSGASMDNWSVLRFGPDRYGPLEPIVTLINPVFKTTALSRVLPGHPRLIGCSMGNSHGGASRCIVLDLSVPWDTMRGVRATSNWDWTRSGAPFWALQESPDGRAHLFVDSKGLLWVGRLVLDARSNLTALEMVGQHDFRWVFPRVAWDQRSDTVYWVDGRSVFGGTLSAPTQ